MMKLFITEDQEMYLEGLTLLLKRKNDIVISGTAATGNELLASLPSLSEAILLLDVHLPDMDEETLLKEIRTGKSFSKDNLSHPYAGYPVCSQINEVRYSRLCFEKCDAWKNCTKPLKLFIKAELILVKRLM
jgi:CheY-like chemotaxis protein